MRRDNPEAKDRRSLERQNTAAELEKKGYPANFSSVDGKVRYNAARVNFGASLFKKYTGKPDPVTLDDACKYGWHDALVQRTELNFKIITDDKILEDEKSEAKKMLLADLEILGLHYWSVGSFHASRILLDIGDYYALKNPEQEKDNPYATNARFYRELSASYFFRAKLLAKESTSAYLAKILHHVTDMDKALAEYQDWASEKLLTKINVARQPELEDGQRELIQRLTRKN